ncbi:MAG: type I methionyl aminopeptidase [Eubacteriaceae bacterium]|nr:type I methionyl aminopeptidase [Eubacteriaceae bacterium]
MINIKTDHEIEIMLMAGRITKKALAKTLEAVKPGVSTLELDQIALDVILSENAVPAFLNYNGFPKSICASVNDEIVHGIPSLERILVEGDIVSIDVGAIFNGYVGDCADTIGVGSIGKEAQRLIDVTRQSFYEGFAYCKPGCRLQDISAAIQAHVEANGFSIVRDYVGHGIGSKMHEDPSVPNFGKAGRGVRLEKGMTLAIEPMVNQGTHKTKLMADGWTAKTADESLSAHYENTIAITSGTPVILTEL